MNAAQVLVVEDEKPLRDVYELILTRAGYSVATAHNGKDALAHMKHAMPAFILLDIFMPIMNGLEFLRSLGTDGIAETCVVVFSNNSDSGLRDEAVALGARDVVLKSDISPSNLVELVGKYVSA